MSEILRARDTPQVVGTVGTGLRPIAGPSLWKLTSDQRSRDGQYSCCQDTTQQCAPGAVLVGHLGHAAEGRPQQRTAYSSQCCAHEQAFLPVRGPEITVQGIAKLAEPKLADRAERGGADHDRPHRARGRCLGRCGGVPDGEAEEQKQF